MDLTPSQVSSASFQTVKKGYDPSQVDAFLLHTAKALEDAQQQATAMEARARAAVARLQEVTTAQEQAAAADAAGQRQGVVEQAVSAGDAEMISRTLLLAQRTADAAVAEARTEADRLLSEARAESETTIDSTREMSAKLLDEARVEARKASDTERRAAEHEVQSLVERRQLLVGDVDQLEGFLVDQRDRLRGAARQIEALCERVPDGLGQVHRPSLSVPDARPMDETGEMLRPPRVVEFPELEDALDQVTRNASGA
jgi:DivIVA domain-containing protein